MKKALKSFTQKPSNSLTTPVSCRRRNLPVFSCPEKKFIFGYQHKKEKKKTLKHIKDRFDSQLENAKDEIKDILKELRQEKSEKIARRSYARLAELEQGFRADLQTLEEKDCYKELDWEQVKINDKVMLKELNQEVTVLSLPDKSGNLFIQMGMIKTKVKQDKLAVYDK